MDGNIKEINYSNDKIIMKGKLYHSPGYWCSLTKEKIESIFNLGFIGTKDDIYRYLGKDSEKYFMKSLIDRNGNTKVSLARKSLFLDIYRLVFGGRNCYDDFIDSYDKISFVINKKVLKDFPYEKAKLFEPHFTDEVLIAGSIPLLYVDAIAINIPIINQMVNGELSFENSKILDSYYDNIEQIDEIDSLLSKYNLEIPIVDLDTGIIIELKR